MDAATVTLKKSLYMKIWMTQADCPNEASKVKTIISPSLLLSSNKMNELP